MRLQTIVISGLILSGCTRSCVKPQPSASDTKSQETWPLEIKSLQPALTLEASAPTELLLTKDKLTVKQTANSLTFDVFNWDKPDFAKIVLGKNRGYFKWDVVAGDKRTSDRPYKCSDAPDAPEAVTRVEETFMQKQVEIYLEDEAKVVVFKLEAVAGAESFWVQSGSFPLKQCNQKN